jgi:hypothetical protein
MFGAIKFMVSGAMACGIAGDELIARIGPEGYEKALLAPQARPMDFTGRPIRSVVHVAQTNLARRHPLAVGDENGDAAHAARVHAPDPPSSRRA